MPDPYYSTTPTITVVVISYNYDRYLATAIDSALGQTYPVDVFVIDDGSTDRSREVIKAYGSRIRTLFKENGGNSSVVNAALAFSRAKIIMFLDADDILFPTAADEVAAAWTTDCSKVQFRLSLLDAVGHVIGMDPPAQTPMPSGDVVPQLLATGSYVTPVTTGNAFRRTVLEHLLPIPVAEFRNTNDGYLNPLCPFFGPVISIDRPLGGYRLHGRNLWAFTAVVDLAAVRQRVDYDLARQRYLRLTAAEHGAAIAEDLPQRDALHVLLRLASLRCEPATHLVPSDTVGSLTRAGLLAAAGSSSQYDPLERATYLLAMLGIATVPRSAVLRICDLVLASRRRPRWVRSVASGIRGVARLWGVGGKGR